MYDLMAAPWEDPFDTLRLSAGWRFAFDVEIFTWFNRDPWQWFTRNGRP